MTYQVNQNPREAIATLDSQNASESARDARIAIIGGGVSGLTAAYYLQKNGYRNITLFESEQEVGGKVRTIEIDGHAIDIGALVTTHDNPTLLEMGLDLQVLHERQERPRMLFLSTNERGDQIKSDWDKCWEDCSLLQWVKGMYAFYRVIHSRDFGQLFTPGYHDLHPDLVKLNLLEFAQKYRFKAILEPFRIALYGSGYRTLEDTPALYNLKIIRCFVRALWNRWISLGRNHGFFSHVGGFQQLWQNIARKLTDTGLTILLNSPVTHVQRRLHLNNRSEITITTRDDAFVFDKLFVTCSPHPCRHFMDATPEEIKLFDRVTYFYHDTVIFRAEGLKEGEMIMLRDKMKQLKPNQLVVYLNDWPGTRLFYGFQCDTKFFSERELNESVEQTIASLGGRVTEIIRRTHWEYFPHVKLEHLDQNYYPRLNALQGENGTFYLGSFFAFETVDHCAEFAKYIVNKHMPPVLLKYPIMQEH